jgi:hypothetical protein
MVIVAFPTLPVVVVAGLGFPFCAQAEITVDDKIKQIRLYKIDFMVFLFITSYERNGSELQLSFVELNSVF